MIMADISLMAWYCHTLIDHVRSWKYYFTHFEVISYIFAKVLLLKQFFQPDLVRGILECNISRAHLSSFMTFGIVFVTVSRVYLTIIYIFLVYHDGCVLCHSGNRFNTGQRLHSTCFIIQFDKPVCIFLIYFW